MLEAIHTWIANDRKGQDENATELPLLVQGALGFMQLVIEKVENGEDLTPSELHLLSLAGAYAVEAG